MCNAFYKGSTNIWFNIINILKFEKGIVLLYFNKSIEKVIIIKCLRNITLLILNFILFI
jgi:hypothetical protein